MGIANYLLTGFEGLPVGGIHTINLVKLHDYGGHRLSRGTSFANRALCQTALPTFMLISTD